MASYRYERDITPGDLAPRREKQYTRRERWANWWDYNLKWVLIIGIAVVFVAYNFIGQYFFTTKADYNVAVVAPYYLPEDTVNALQTRLAPLGEDLNGDGKVVVTLNVYTLDYSDEDTQTESAAYLTMAGTTKLAADVQGGLSSVFLLYDPAGFEESTGTLTLTGTGATPDYTPKSLPPFAAHRSQIRTVQVEDGITGLGDNLLRQLTAVTDVQLPDSLRTIGSNTFFHVAALQSIRIPAGVTGIGSYAFAACSSLTDIQFDNMAGSLQLGACAFIDCKALTAAQFPVGTGFGQYAVGYQDEDGRPMTAFTLRGLTGTTAQYYADAAAQITFDPALELTQGATFGNTFQSYSGTDWYRYTPTATGTYHFYSMGSVDTCLLYTSPSPRDTR